MTTNSENKKKPGVNLVDALILLVIVAAVAGAAYKFNRSGVAANIKGQQSIQVVLYNVDVPEFAAKAVKAGDPVVEESGKALIGYVKEVKIEPSKVPVNTDDGKYAESTRPGYVSVYITVEGKGLMDGASLNFGGNQYFYGKPLDFDAGNAYLKLYIASVQPIGN